jgi:hypothetical protein
MQRPDVSGHAGGADARLEQVDLLFEDGVTAIRSSKWGRDHVRRGITVDETGRLASTDDDKFVVRTDGEGDVDHKA